MILRWRLTFQDLIPEDTISGFKLISSSSTRFGALASVSLLAFSSLAAAQAAPQTPAQCAERGSLGSAFTVSSGPECAVSSSCQIVKNALTQAEIDARKAYARFCEARAQAEKRERDNPCKENCQKNQAEADQLLTKQVTQLRDEMLRIRNYVDEARRAALEEGLDMGRKMNVETSNQPVRKSDLQRLQVSAGIGIFSLTALFFPTPALAAQAGYCVDKDNRPTGRTFDDSEVMGNTIPCFPMAANFDSSRGKIPAQEKKALTALKEGNSVDPSSLEGMSPFIKEPLLAASEAQKAEDTIGSRINELNQNLAALAKQKAHSDSRAERLASMGASSAPPVPATFEMPKKALELTAKGQGAPDSSGPMNVSAKIERLEFRIPQDRPLTESDLNLDKDPSHSALAAALNMGAEQLSAGSGISQPDKLPILAPEKTNELHAEKEEVKPAKSTGKEDALRDKLARQLAAAKL